MLNIGLGTSAKRPVSAQSIWWKWLRNNCLNCLSQHVPSENWISIQCCPYTTYTSPSSCFSTWASIYCQRIQSLYGTTYILTVYCPAPVSPLEPVFTIREFDFLYSSAYILLMLCPAPFFLLKPVLLSENWVSYPYAIHIQCDTTWYNMI